MSAFPTVETARLVVPLDPEIRHARIERLAADPELPRGLRAIAVRALERVQDRRALDRRQRIGQRHVEQVRRHRLGARRARRHGGQAEIGRADGRPGASAAARSITLRSSRTLPGQR